MNYPFSSLKLPAFLPHSQAKMAHSCLILRQKRNILASFSGKNEKFLHRYQGKNTEYGRKVYCPNSEQEKLFFSKNFDFALDKPLSGFINHIFYSRQIMGNFYQKRLDFHYMDARVRNKPQRNRSDE